MTTFGKANWVTGSSLYILGVILVILVLHRDTCCEFWLLASGSAVPRNCQMLYQF